LIEPGSLVAMVAFGAGFVWGAAVSAWKDGPGSRQRRVEAKVETRSR
jgi:hypothetical protein